MNGMKSRRITHNLYIFIKCCDDGYMTMKTMLMMLLMMMITTNMVGGGGDDDVDDVVDHDVDDDDDDGYGGDDSKYQRQTLGNNYLTVINSSPSIIGRGDDTR